MAFFSIRIIAYFLSLCKSNNLFHSFQRNAAKSLPTGMKPHLGSDTPHPRVRSTNAVPLYLPRSDWSRPKYHLLTLSTNLFHCSGLMHIAVRTQPAVSDWALEIFSGHALVRSTNRGGLAGAQTQISAAKLTLTTSSLSVKDRSPVKPYMGGGRGASRRNAHLLTKKHFDNMAAISWRGRLHSTHSAHTI